MSSKARVILIGTSDFAEKIFSKLKEVGLPSVEIVGVVTAVDKPVGRKQVLTQSPVKTWAVESNIPLLQPENINNPKSIEQIKNLKPDLIILTAYGQIISKELLDIPARGIINIHPSLLPKYRGASPIQTTILNGDQETGVTIMLMDEKMDHGEVIFNSQFTIFNKPNYQELSDKLADLGAELLIETLPDYLSGKIKPIAQDHSQATFTKIIKKEDGQIDWNKAAKEIEQQIRAFSQWPNAFTFFKDKQLKILKVRINLPTGEKKKTDNKIGQVFLDEEKLLNVQTKDGALIIEELQLEGKQATTAKDFLNGHPDFTNSLLQ